MSDQSEKRDQNYAEGASTVIENCSALRPGDVRLQDVLCDPEFELDLELSAPARRGNSATEALRNFRQLYNYDRSLGLAGGLE